MERSVAFHTDHYQRVLERGVLLRLPSDLRQEIRLAYDESRNANQIIASAWGHGRWTNQWAEGVNEGNRRLFDARLRSIDAVNALRTYLNP